MEHYFLRIGALGEIRLASALVTLSAGRRVVVRSPRGIEIGEVVSPCRQQSSTTRETTPNYRILRPTSQQDEMLARRLAFYKDEAMELCRTRLRESGCQAALLEVDQLLDGGTLVMHFLGELDTRADEISREIARHYESVVRTNHLSELLQDGCGPDCGTTAGCGSACGSCTGCGT